MINGRWELRLPEHRAEFHAERPWWEAARLSDMCAVIKPHQTLIDIGSEEGDLTALYASWGANVAYIDPSKAWVAQTIEIFQANDLTPGPAFIGLCDDYNYIEGRPVEEARFVTIDEKVARITLDTFCDWNDLLPDAVTMDVEGSEVNVLRGAEMTLARGAVWWISIHGDVDPHAAMPSKVHEFMRERDYVDQFLAYDHEWHYRFWRP